MEPSFCTTDVCIYRFWASAADGKPICTKIRLQISQENVLGNLPILVDSNSLIHPIFRLYRVWTLSCRKWRQRKAQIWGFISSLKVTYSERTQSGSSQYFFFSLDGDVSLLVIGPEHFRVVMSFVVFALFLLNNRHYFIVLIVVAIWSLIISLDLFLGTSMPPLLRTGITTAAHLAHAFDFFVDSNQVMLVPLVTVVVAHGQAQKIKLTL